MIAVKRVVLGQQHLSPGRTVHRISDSKGVRPFPPFKSLVIAHYPESTGYYLFHLCADGPGADTWHESLEDLCTKLSGNSKSNQMSGKISTKYLADLIPK